MTSLAIRFKGDGLKQAVEQDGAAIVKALRPAAQAGAQVLYDAVKANVSRIKPKTGNLARSIYQAYSQDNSSPATAEYHVSYNAAKAPHGHLVEYGHIQKYQQYFSKKLGRFVTVKSRPLAKPRQIAARPFIRPAAITHAEAALQAAEDRLFAELDQAGVTG